MATIEAIKNKGEFIKKQTAIGSVTNEVVGQQFVDISEVLGQEVAALSKLGVLKTYASFSEMEKDASAPIGDDGDAILHGQLVAVLDKTSPNENGLYSYTIKEGMKSWQKRSDISIPTDTARKGGYEGTLATLNGVKADKILASDTQNGLLSKEQNKFINDLIKEYPMIEEVLKPDHEKYLTTFAVIFKNGATLPTNINTPHIVVTSTVSGSDVENVLIETDIKRITQLNAQRQGVRLTPSCINDRLVIRGNKIASISANSLSIIGADELVFSSTELEFKTLNAQGSYSRIDIISPYIQNIDVSYNKVTELFIIGLSQLKKVVCKNAKVLIRVNHANTLLEELDFSGCDKLVGLSNMVGATSFPNLLKVNITKTSYTLVAIDTLGNAWGSRVGKTQGVLTLDQVLYDQLTEEQKIVFTDKNIAFDIVA